MHPTDRLTPEVEAIAQGIVHACCLREENLYVAEFVAGDHMVRTCRRCHAKHHTMKIDPVPIALGLNRLSTVTGRPGGGRHFTAGLNPGRLGGSPPRPRSR
jgi:hypothetical protein